MKKVFSSLVIAAAMTFGFTDFASAQEDTTAAATEMTDEATDAADDAVSDAATEGETSTDEEAGKKKEDLGFVQALKQKFIEGDPFWMTLPLICLIIGLALSIERIVYLNLSLSLIHISEPTRL